MEILLITLISFVFLLFLFSRTLVKLGQTYAIIKRMGYISKRRGPGRSPNSKFGIEMKELHEHLIDIWRK